MSATQWIGAGLLLLPLAVVFALAVVSIGWQGALFIFGAAAALVVVVVAGAYLLAGGAS